jgi:phosphoribosylglycinamide formyltransferase 2
MHARRAAEARQDIAKAVTDNLGGAGRAGGWAVWRGAVRQGRQVWFSEVSPRPHDTGMVTMITQWQNEFELHARAILGLPVDTTLKSPGASAVIYGGVEAHGIVFDGVDEALRLCPKHRCCACSASPRALCKRRMGVALAPHHRRCGAKARAS